MESKVNNWKTYVLLGCFLVSFIVNLCAFSKCFEKGRVPQGTYQTGTDITASYIITDGNGNILRYNQLEGITWIGKYHYVKGMIYHLELEDGGSCDVLYDSNELFWFDKQTGEISIYTKTSSALMLFDVNKIDWPKWCVP